jgi:Tol biopolymer transport system component
LAVLVVPTSAHAAFPGQNGKIAFSVGAALWTMNADGSNRAPFNNLRGIAPAWSPDGGRLAYQSDDGVHVVNGDGSGDALIVPGARAPAWSPTGTQLDVVTGPADGCSELTIVKDDGTVISSYSDPDCDFLTCCLDAPAWSPSGSPIVFELRVYEPDPDTCEPGDCPFFFGPPQLSIGARAATANWAPGANELAAARNFSFPHGIAVFRPDGTEARRLTTNGADRQPAWSPDGTKIAFERTGAIYVMNAADGAAAASLGTGSQPDWQPVFNHPPDCSGVAASRSVLTTVNRKLVPVTLDGATDPDGDPVTLSVDGVTQDEPVTSRGDQTSPDAVDERAGELRIRAERNPHGDGRVYRIAFTASDGRGGECSGIATVSVPRKKHKAAVDSAPPSYDSLGQ